MSYKEKVTTGVVRYSDEFGEVTTSKDGIFEGSKSICYLNAFGKTAEEIVSNGTLIAESFNVLNESGLTPRELLDQRDELMESLKELYAFSQVALSHIKVWRTEQNKNPELEEGIEKYSNKAIELISKINSTKTK